MWVCTYIENIIFVDDFNEIIDKYDAFVIDQFGVIHNGQTAFDSALKCIENINNSQKVNHISYTYIYACLRLCL